jgi:hypothetical protein
MEAMKDCATWKNRKTDPAIYYENGSEFLFCFSEKILKFYVLPNHPLVFKKHSGAGVSDRFFNRIKDNEKGYTSDLRWESGPEEK